MIKFASSEHNLLIKSNENSKKSLTSNFQNHASLNNEI